ncbi:hypothetical protein L9F63_008506, partial [Diploptera punctata]
CTSCERSLNYATKMARMLQSSTLKFTGTCVACMGMINVRGIEAAILNDRRVQLRALSQKFNISYVSARW